MASLNFPNPESGITTYTAAGVTWTYNPVHKVWSSEGGGGGASVSVGENPPSGAAHGDLWWNSGEDDGRLYIYYADEGTTQWVETSPGFDGNYNNLTNKPPLFGLEDGTYENNLLTWLTVGGVTAWSSTNNGGATEGTRNYSYASQPTTVVTGSGNGELTVSFRKRPDGSLENFLVNNPGEGYSTDDTFSFTIPITGQTVTGIVSETTTAQIEGWYSQPGSNYFVSATKSANYIGVPNFVNGSVIGLGGDFDEDQFALGSFFHGPVKGRAHAVGYSAGASVQYNGYTTGSYFINKYDKKNHSSALQQSSISLSASRTISLTTYDDTGENAQVNLKCEADGTLNALPTFNNTNSNSSNYLRITNTGVIQRSTSSKRYKDNIRDLALTNAEALNIIDALQPRLWEDYESGETVAGLVAEEVFAVAGEYFVSFSPWSQEQTFTEVDQEGNETTTTSTVYPLVGNGETPVTKDGGPLTDESEVVDGLNDRALILALLKAVQELKDRVEALEGA